MLKYKWSILGIPACFFYFLSTRNSFFFPICMKTFTKKSFRMSNKFIFTPVLNKKIFNKGENSVGVQVANSVFTHFTYRLRKKIPSFINKHHRLPVIIKNFFYLNSIQEAYWHRPVVKLSIKCKSAQRNRMCSKRISKELH